MRKLFGILKFNGVHMFLKERENAWGFIFIIPAYMYYIPTLLQYGVLYYYGGAINQEHILILSSILNFMIGGITVFLIVITMKRFLSLNFKDFKKKWLNDFCWSITVGYALTYVASLIGMTIQYSILGDAVSQNSANQELFVVLQNINPMIMFFTAVVFAPIVEEVIFRGLLFSNLYKFNAFVAHLLSAFLFGFIHVYSYILSGDFTQFIYMIPYVLMGLTFSYAYHRRGNIIVPIILHAFSNVVAFMLTYI